ncbi:hypothetical protein JIG36_35715 [Actinoplanes sp. LDG1-06]|uniref:Uncharacterized protein n=1 Tax=Paractinoplanes ovalisporus TaxID=2810368 RepID=A0ABS2ALW7_9ACTN|nr:hypothetical protein [Actinoplanes ovalisporus]MBM2620862.1 hypothetical protein [Actinoplanes ovalisporus]
MASHRDDDEPSAGTRRARMTLRIAVAVSVVLIGATALFVVLTREPGEKPSPAALPGVWNPPPLSVPDASEPPSEDPTPTPAATTPARKRTTPPATRKPAVTPALTVTQQDVPAVVDLAAQGARDWVHWGLADPGSVNRRSGGTGEIKDLDITGGHNRYDNNPQSFTWTGGAPTAATGPSPTGLYVCQPGGSFAVSVSAAPAIRTLRLYAGVWAAKGQLTATLAGRTVTATLENPQTNGTAVFILKFRAPAGETLRVTWVNAVQHHPTCGNVDIQAAALS